MKKEARNMVKRPSGQYSRFRQRRESIGATGSEAMTLDGGFPGSEVAQIVNVERWPARQRQEMSS